MRVSINDDASVFVEKRLFNANKITFSEEKEIFELLKEIVSELFEYHKDNQNEIIEKISKWADLHCIDQKYRTEEMMVRKVWEDGRNMEFIEEIFWTPKLNFNLFSCIFYKIMKYMNVMMRQMFGNKIINS